VPIKFVFVSIAKRKG